MKTSFQRLLAKDGIELHGLLYEPDQKTEKVFVHVHGMGGNFYENKFVDFLAEELTAAGISLCVFNNRGCEFIKDTYRIVDGKEPEFVTVGTTYERFEECVFDIEAYLDFVESQGFSEMYLSGHSLGCPKVAYYLSETQDKRVSALLFLSPADMLGLVRQDMSTHERFLEKARELVAAGQENEILPERLWGEYPVSAGTYINLFADEAKDAIFNFYKPEDTLETFANIQVPTYAVMGRKDDALVISIEDTFARLEKALTNSPKVTTQILGEANHGYRGHESELAGAVVTWLTNLSK